MHVIRVTLDIKPESRQAFDEIAALEYNEVPKQFSGCKHFAYWNSIVNDNQVLLYEEWDSVEDFDNYRTSDYFKELGQKLFPLLAGKPDAAYYKADLAEQAD